MAKDPSPPAKKLQEGERVVAYLRRKRLENVLTGFFFVGILTLLAGGYLQWAYETRMALFAALVILAVPIGVVTNTHYWLTDRRVVRSVVGVVTGFPVGDATPRVVKDPLSNTVRFETPDGKPALVVKHVDNAPKVLRAHAEAAKPAEPAQSPDAAPATGEAAS